MTRAPTCILRLAVCGVWLSGGVARANDLQRISDEVGALGLQVQSLADEKVTAEAKTGMRPYEARFADAEVYYSMGDYAHAALVLYGLAQPGDQDQPAYGKVVQYLAESFFQMNNDLLANRYFHTIFVRQDKAAMPDAARRMIQIAERRQVADSLDDDLAALRALGPLPADIAYSYAKNLVHRHRGELAYAVAGEVPDTHADWLKARYLRGVALADKPDATAALQIFSDLATDAQVDNPNYADGGEIKVLAQINRARLLFEVGRSLASEKAYAEVPNGSAVYNDALYEQTWVILDAAANAPDDELAQEAYLRAQHVLELLLLDPSNTPLTPEARILSANILVRLGKFPAAEAAFADVVKDYKPIWDNVESLAHAHRDVTAIFLPSDNEVNDPSAPALPPLAAHFATQEKTLARTVELSRELEENETWLNECDAMVEKLQRALEVQEQAHVTLALQELQGRRMELQNHLTDLTARLLQIERGVLTPLLDAEHAKQLQDILAERATLEPEYRKLPQTRSDYAGRDRALRERLNDLQKQAYDLKWVMVASKQQIEALRKWMADHPETLTPQSTVQLNDELHGQEKVLGDLEKTRAGINREIDEQRTVLSVSNATMSQEDALRARYSENLERERKVLGSATSALSGDEGAAMDKVASLRGTLASYHDALEKFAGAMAQAAATGTTGARAGLQQTQDALLTQRQEMGTVRKAASGVVPDLAAQSLGHVRDKLRDIVVRGDVGIVDIAWGLKESQEEQLNRQVSESHDEMQNLEQEAKDILKD